MKRPDLRGKRRFSLPHPLLAITPAELAASFKQLPTVPESEMPDPSHAKGTFRGLIQHEGLEGHTRVASSVIIHAHPC